VHHMLICHVAHTREYRFFFKVDNLLAHRATAHTLSMLILLKE
jgi:hypothetical protein